MKQIFTFLAAVVLTASTFAQVGIGTTTPAASAALDITSTTQGFLPPRMTAAQRNSISNPSAGLLLWCSDCGANGELNVFNGSAFTAIDGSAAAAAAPVAAVFSSTQIGGDIDFEAAGDSQGASVSLSSDGTIVAIGAPNNGGTASKAGHVRVYQNISGTWTQLGSDIDGEAADDQSGISVSLSGNGTIVAIGGWRNDGNGIDSGHVRVYEYTNNIWAQLGGDIDGEAENDYSGRSISLSSDGTIVAIGANGNDGNGNGSGHVRVYEYTNNTWAQLGSDIDGEAASDYSGTSVSLSSDGTIVAIGAQFAVVNSGKVAVYQYISGTWTRLGSPIFGEAVNDEFGCSISLSSDGTIVAIGAYGNDGNGSYAGRVRVYEYTNNDWNQLGGDIDGEAAGDSSGSSVSLSGNGTIVAIGANGNDGNGIDSGHVRVYKNISGTWTQLGSDINGEAAGDSSGSSVSLSSDGTIVAIGASGGPAGDPEAPDNVGHVRIYN